MHEVLVNRLGGLSLPRKSVVRLTDRPYMTLDVYRGRKTTIKNNIVSHTIFRKFRFSNISEAICHFSAFGALIYSMQQLLTSNLLSWIAKHFHKGVYSEGTR